MGLEVWVAGGQESSFFSRHGAFRAVSLQSWNARFAHFWTPKRARGEERRGLGDAASFPTLSSGTRRQEPKLVA